MSLLTPERVPVEVYRWDDVGAPALDKTAGCMMAIFKACLVTGYGGKTSAGWTTPFEDVGSSVLKPKNSALSNFYLKLSADTGSQMDVVVYQTMTDDGYLIWQQSQVEQNAMTACRLIMCCYLGGKTASVSRSGCRIARVIGRLITITI